MKHFRISQLIMAGFASAALLGGVGCNSTSGSLHLGWNNYGANAAASEDAPVALGILDDNYEGHLIVKGNITSVCQSKGCWMTIADGGREVRVKFKDYAFFVPMNAAGRRVVVKGWGNPTVMDVEWARHLAEDAGKSKAEIEAITKPVKTYEIEATAVYIEGQNLDEPRQGG